MGSYLKSFAKSPKNPCLPEYDFALAYFDAVLCQHEGKLDEARSCISKARDLYKKMVKKSKMKEVDEKLHPHSERMLLFLESRQEMLIGNLQAELRRMPRSADVTFFNNQGALHLRMGKYALATYWLQKAAKALRTGPQSAKAPLETVTDHVDRRASDVLFNLGLSLFH